MSRPAIQSISRFLASASVGQAGGRVCVDVTGGVVAGVVLDVVVATHTTP